MESFTFSPGRLPVLVSMPHPGMHIPDAIADLTPEARVVPDTDWQVPRLSDFR